MVRIDDRTDNVKRPADRRAQPRSDSSFGHLVEFRRVRQSVSMSRRLADESRGKMYYLVTMSYKAERNEKIDDKTSIYNITTT